MRTVFTVVLAVSITESLVALSPEELVKQSIQNYLHHYREAATHYTFTQRDVEKNGDTTKVTVSRVLIVDGLPFERVTSRNGQLLTPAQDAKEQAKLEKRRGESRTERAKRLHEYNNAPQFLQEVPDAFTFTELMEDTVEGRPNYVIDCRPKPGYRAHSSRAAMFSHIQAKLWIDKENIQWTKADAQVLDTISIGWIMARIGPGATITMEEARLNDKDWLPKLIDINGDAKIMLVKDHPLHEEITSSDFKAVSAQAAGIRAPHQK